MPKLRLLTIGLYGFTAEGFFSALAQASVDVLCDVRHRRGVRGNMYTFANSRRLQAGLAADGIGYVHCKELSPPEEILQLQRAADKRARVGQRQRQVLGEAFAKAYRELCLHDFDATDFLRRLEAVRPNCHSAALFCVEASPGACHRSLLADRLAADLKIEVEHLVPAEPTGA